MYACEIFSEKYCVFLFNTRVWTAQCIKLPYCEFWAAFDYISNLTPVSNECVSEMLQEYPTLGASAR